MDYESLLNAVKNDDVTLFGRFLSDGGDLACRFGRFPLLSLCYLHGSNRILRKYEKKMLKIPTYPTVLREDRASYLIFRAKAGRALHLYVQPDSVVTPLETLAVLQKHDYLQEVYKKGYADDASRARISYIESTICLSPTACTEKKIKIRRKKESSAKTVFALASAVLALLFFAAALAGTVYADGLSGGKTADNPLPLYNDAQIELALQENGFFTLEKDVSLDCVQDTFAGSLDGNGHTITLQGDKPLFAVFNGTLSNVHIVCDRTFIGENKGVLENVTFSWTESEISDLKNDFSFFIAQNNGTIRNSTASVTCDLTLSSEHEETCVNLFGKENKGTLENLSVFADITVRNPVPTDAYFSALCADNFGTIRNCILEKGSSIVSETVDIGGLCVRNGSPEDKTKSATISDCVVYADLSQTCAEKQWSPNVSSVAVHNYAVVENCSCENNLYAAGTYKPTEEETDKGVILCGGLVGTNCGTIKESSFSGSIETNSDSFSSYLGGIASWNGTVKTNEDKSRTYLFGTIENCSAQGQITAESADEAYSYIGGVTANNYGNFIPGVTNYGFFQQTVYTYYHSVINGCSAQMTFSGNNLSYQGGISSVNSGVISSCETKITGAGNDDCLFGGIAAFVACNYDTGYSQTSFKAIFDCFSDVTATGKNGCRFGGTAAFCRGASGLTPYLENNVATGKATCGDASYIGGVVGQNITYVRFCQATCDLTAGNESFVGGVAGYNGGGILSCLAKGTLAVGEKGLIGGTVGQNAYQLQNNFVCISRYEYGTESQIGYQAGQIDLNSINYYIAQNYHVSVDNVPSAYGIITGYEPKDEEENAKAHNHKETSFESVEVLTASEAYKSTFTEQEEENKNEEGIKA